MPQGSSTGQSVMHSGGLNNTFDAKIRYQKQNNSMLNPQAVYKGKGDDQGGRGLPDQYALNNSHRVAGNPLSAGQAQAPNSFGLQMTTQDTLNNSSSFPQDPSSPSYNNNGAKPSSSVFGKRNSRASKSRGATNKSPANPDVQNQSMAHGSPINSP
jgi:hypothetical protein